MGMLLFLALLAFTVLFFSVFVPTYLALSAGKWLRNNTSKGSGKDK